MFTAPSDGVYVFTWTIISGGNSIVCSQIVINSHVFSNMVTDSDEVGDIHSSTKVIVVSLNHGDVVFIRTHQSILSQGTVLSDDVHGRPSFSGWKL